jgi:hypothetical protein
MCDILAIRLGDAERQLAGATSRMRALTGAKHPEDFQQAFREAESLGMESQAIRAEAERHKAQHHWASTEDFKDSSALASWRNKTLCRTPRLR